MKNIANTSPPETRMPKYFFSNCLEKLVKWLLGLFTLVYMH